MKRVRIVLRPLGAEAFVSAGAPLADALAPHDVEFPCGGRGRCRGCRLRLLSGSLPESPADTAMLSEAERAAGWRLACQAHPRTDLEVELRQWAGLILADETPFPFEPAEDLGLAVDIGTTTLAAQLVDLATGTVLGTRTALNPQSRAGADVMSRICAALAPSGTERLTAAVREAVAALVTALLAGEPSGRPVVRAALVGNTAMQHLFLGRDVSPLARAPFETPAPDSGWPAPARLGWPARARDARVHVLPVLGGFVGADALAVILATRLLETGAPAAAADLGTNGEIMVAAGGRVLVASTAAGPAFEGARISCGMRAAPGAVDRVSRNGRGLLVHVIGYGPARGICGSGLVDAVACGLASGEVTPSGRLARDPWPIHGAVSLTQRDVRELQLAKGAIAAGFSILLERAALPLGDVTRCWLAGAFGHGLDPRSAAAIGLLPFPADRVASAGNAALLGAKVALGLPDLGYAACAAVRARATHVSLDADPTFHDRFAEAMAFPGGA